MLPVSSDCWTLLQDLPTLIWQLRFWYPKLQQDSLLLLWHEQDQIPTSRHSSTIARTGVAVASPVSRSRTWSSIFCSLHSSSARSRLAVPSWITVEIIKHLNRNQHQRHLRMGEEEEEFSERTLRWSTQAQLKGSYLIHSNNSTPQWIRIRRETHLPQMHRRQMEVVRWVMLKLFTIRRAHRHQTVTRCQRQWPCTATTTTTTTILVLLIGSARSPWRASPSKMPHSTAASLTFNKLNQRSSNSNCSERQSRDPGTESWRRTRLRACFVLWMIRTLSNFRHLIPRIHSSLSNHNRGANSPLSSG